MVKAFELNFRHLRALSAVVEMGSFSRAAQHVGLSQPALTQGLAKLERQLNVSLFERRADGVSPTLQGAALAERSARAFAFLASAARKLGNKSSGFSRPEWLMTATQLQAFYHFSTAETFVGTASLTGSSQPAVHRAIRDLEQICGATLVERRGRGMALTLDGKMMGRGVRLAVNEISAGLVEIRGDGADVARISIGAMPLCRAILLPHAISKFLALESGTVINVIEGSWRELIEPLRDGVIDIVIGALRDNPPKGLKQIPLSSDPIEIFGRYGHPLSFGAPVSVEQLQREQWVIGPEGTPLRNHWEALFEGRTLPDVPIECGSVMVIRGVLSQTDLLTLLSPAQVNLEVSSQILAKIPFCFPPYERKMGLTIRENWKPTKHQQHLLDIIQNTALVSKLQEN